MINKSQLAARTSKYQMKKKIVDNSAIDAFMAKVESIAEDAWLPDDLSQALDRALEDDRLGLCEDCENPMED